MTERVADAEELPAESLAELAVSSWKLGRMAIRLLEKLDASEIPKNRSQVLWLTRSLEKSLDALRVNVVDTQGQLYDPGMAVTPLNIDDFNANEQLVVDQMVEPIVMGPAGLIRSGTVLLRRASE